MVAADDMGEQDDLKLENSTGKRKTLGRERQPRTPSKNKPKNYEKATPETGASRSSQVDDGSTVRTRSRSAPAKRIVSDGHWKMKRSPPKSGTTSRTSKDAIGDRSRGSYASRIRPASDTKGEETHIARDQKTPSKWSSVRGDDGIRVYVTPPGSRRNSTRPRRRGNGLSESKDEHASDVGIGDAGQSEELDDRPKRSFYEDSVHNSPPESKIVSERKVSGAKKPARADKSPRSARSAPVDSKGSVKSSKGNVLAQVFGESKRAFAKQAPEPIPTPRIPSIEAWLSETPDPFVATEEPPLDFIAPLKPSVEKKRSERKNEPLEQTEDPNKIWDALNTKEGTRRVVSGSRRKRIPSSAIYEDNPFPEDFDSDTGLSASGKGSTSASKFVDLVQKSPETPPSSLKRRSARKSVSSPARDRQKSRVSRDDALENDTASRASSNHTTSSVGGPEPSNPLRPPGLNVKRPFPSTGQHRLSTIASVETFSTRHNGVAPSISERSENTIRPPPIQEDEAAFEARDHFDPNSLKRKDSRLTKHADLISILSLPKPSSQSIQSARSIRTNRSRLATATIGDLMRELSTDESKYMRELRTLVDGVIPVLLTCVLSKSDSAVAAGLFRPSAPLPEDPNFTRPIVDMGIALERLKTLHKRIPHDDPTALLTWAHGAQRVYTEYLKAWRMGFQDVVVNLAPAADNSSPAADQPSTNAEGLEAGLPRNEDGDVVNGDGERVDVAFLLRRPLVRLKYLQKTLKGINFLKPSTEAELLATRYQKLVDDARQRSNEERARLEDEAASNTDSTRTRDPRNLAPLAGVTIDRTRRVRARDNFNLALQHSSGQYVDCHVELVLRDEASDIGGGGDLLVCEVDATGKWLLFPPIQFDRVSARNGDLKGEIVVMIRGINSDGSEWQELFSMRSEDEHTGFEWVQMLGLTPVPPKILRTQSFLNKHQKRKSATSSNLATPSSPKLPAKSRTPSPREIEVPIGEQANDSSRMCIEPATGETLSNQHTLPSQEPTVETQEFSVKANSRSSNYVDQVSDLRSLPSQMRLQKAAPATPARTPRSFKEALGLSGSSTTVGLKRARANRRSRHGEGSPSSARSNERDRLEKESHTRSEDIVEKQRPATASLEDTQWSHSVSSEPSRDSLAGSHKGDADDLEGSSRPPNHRSRSSVPSRELPYIPKARQNSPPTTPTFELEQELEWPTTVDPAQKRSPSKLTKKPPVSPKAEARLDSSPPSTPTHRSTSPVQLNGAKIPILAKTQTRPRRSSSPLKHEYEPSTASDSSSDSDASTVERKGATSVSDSSEDEDLEEEAPTPLLPLGGLKTFSDKKTITRASPQSTPDGSIKPSESASQAPYKRVPAQPTKATKTIASIFSWSDTGVWQSLHPDECSIVITPGLIEAFEMSAAHSKDVPLSSSTPKVNADAFSDLASNVTSQNDDVRGHRPLVALELTPLVPLRRGTALDISIRSPPTPNSQITSGTNIMFRSRNPEECEALYALINHSRINNPTFIALQNARASGSSFGADRRTSTNAGGSKRSWFGGWGRSSSYRASSAPTPSIAPSDSSIGSMSSAFSALRRFGRGSGMFNISKSTITSREGSRANSVYTSSDNSSGSGSSSPPLPGLITAGKDAPLGLSNAKIRLYARETASKWRDMGSARLTIMRPEKNESELNGRPTSSSGYQGMNEKRIVVTGKTKGEVLLDVQLGESCFERVARTGIAISVWEDVVGPNGEVGVVGAVGGVSGGRANVYMIQVCGLQPKNSFFFPFSSKKLTKFIDEKRSGDGIHIFYRGEITILGDWTFKCQVLAILFAFQFVQFFACEIDD